MIGRVDQRGAYWLTDLTATGSFGKVLTGLAASRRMLDAGGRIAARPDRLRPATAAPEALCERPLDHFEPVHQVCSRPAPRAVAGGGRKRPEAPEPIRARKRRRFEGG